MGFNEEMIAKKMQEFALDRIDWDAPQRCGNCGTWREVNNFIVERCPFCGDDEYSLVESDENVP